MRLHSITVQDYRGIAQQKIDFHDHGITVIAGPNQSGKSSVIEAINLVLTEKATSRKEAVKAIRRSGVDRPAIVELDVTIGGERFTLRKEFGRGRQAGTTLVFADGSKEALRGDPAHNYVQELLAEHEDMALFSALSFLQGKDLASFELTDGQSALQEALDAAASEQNDGAMLGDHILDAAQAECDRYFTKTGRPNKERNHSIQEEEKLTQEIADLKDQIKETHDIAQNVTELATQRDTLADQIHQVEADEKELQQQAKNYAHQRQQKDKLRTQLTANEATLAAAQAVVEADSNLLNQHENVQKRIKNAEKELADLPSADGSEVTELEKKCAQLATALEEMTSATHLVDLVKREYALHDIQEQAKKLREAVDDAAEKRASFAHNPAVYQQAEKLHTETESLRQALNATAGTITITPQTEDSHILCNGGELHESLRADLGQPLTIEVPGHVTIAVEPAAEAAHLHDMLQQQENDYQAALAELHVSDWQSAAAQADAWEKADEAYTTATTDLQTFDAVHPESRLSEEEQTLTQEFATYPTELIDQARAGTLPTLSADDLEELRSGYTETKQRWEAASRDYENACARREVLTQTLNSAREEEQELAPLDEEAMKAHTAALHEQEVTVSKQRAKISDFDAMHADMGDPTPALSDATSALTNLREKYREAENKYQHQQGVLDSHLDLGLHTALEDKEGQCEELSRANKRVTAEAEAARLLRDTLVDARQRTAARYQTPYVTALTALGQHVWGEDFSVNVADNLRIESAITRPGGSPIAYKDLSTGTREQLAVLSRLACYQLVNQGSVPVILDDILGYSDPEHRGDMAKAIETATALAESDPTSVGQLIIFTCDSSRFTEIPGLHLDWNNPTVE